MALPRVHVLTTGGTIASRFDPAAGGFTVADSLQELIAAVPGLEDVAEFEFFPIAKLDSADITPSIWLALARHIAAAEADGYIVTHGTDTMEETAYFLDLTHSTSQPVVLVGAQRAASDFDTDGPRNFLDAARVAASADARSKGVFVVMNQQIHGARDVTKTSTLRLESFQSPEFGPLGYVEEDAVRFDRIPLHREHYKLPSELPVVEIVTHYAGADGFMIDALLDRLPRPAGIVVAATGAGNVNPPMYEAIRRALDVGIRVVISTRVHSGRVMPIYAGAGKGVDLARAGCEFASNLSPQKARIRLMLSIASASEG